MIKKPLEPSIANAYISNILSCADSYNDLKAKDELRFYLNKLEIDAKRALQDALVISDESLKYINTESDVNLSNLDVYEWEYNYLLVSSIANSLTIIFKINQYSFVNNINDIQSCNDFKSLIIDLKSEMRAYRELESENKQHELSIKQSNAGKTKKMPLLICKLVGEMVENALNKNEKISALEVWKKLKKLDNNEFNLKGNLYTLEFEPDCASDEKTAGYLIQYDEKSKPKRIKYAGLKDHVTAAHKYFRKKLI